MKSETFPPPSPSAEAHWVEGELVRSLLRTQRNAQTLGLLLMAVIVGVLWGDVSPGPLAAWALLGVVVAGWRLWILRRYEREVMEQGTDEILAFFRRYRLVWPASALVWGLTTLLYF